MPSSTIITANNDIGVTKHSGLAGRSKAAAGPEAIAVICSRCDRITPRVPCAHCGAWFDPIAADTRLIAGDDHPDEEAIQYLKTDHGSAPVGVHDDLTPGNVTQAGYQIQRLLSNGGMGVVLEAHDPRRHHSVVLKAPRSRQPQARLRFTREARALASCDHPLVVPLLDLDCTNRGTPVIVLPLVAGPTLRGFLEGEQPDLATVERLMVDLARALDHCHRRGVVHRDIKPDNIIVADSGCTLIDFGLALVDVGLPRSRAASCGQLPRAAALTPEGALLGTPPYAAPEQLSDPSEVTAAADMYSFGMVLSEALHACQRTESARRELWRGFAQQLTAVNPSQRPAAHEVIDWAATLPPRLTTTLPLPRTPPTPRWWLPASAAGLATGVAIAASALWSPQPEDHVMRGSLTGADGDIITLRAEPGERLEVNALGNTQLRLPGATAWTPGTLRLPGGPRGHVDIQVSDPDGWWELRVSVR